MNSRFLTGCWYSMERFFRDPFHQLSSLHVNYKINKQDEGRFPSRDRSSSRVARVACVCTLPTIHQDRARVNKGFSGDSSSNMEFSLTEFFGVYRIWKIRYCYPSILSGRRIHSEVGEYQKFSSRVSNPGILILDSRPISTIRGYHSPIHFPWNRAAITIRFKSKSHNFDNSLEFDHLPFGWSIICTDFGQRRNNKYRFS